MSGFAVVLALAVPCQVPQETTVIVETRGGSRFIASAPDKGIRYHLPNQKDPIDYNQPGTIQRIEIGFGSRVPGFADLLVVGTRPNIFQVNLLTSEFAFTTEFGPVTLRKDDVRSVVYLRKPAAKPEPGAAAKPDAVIKLSGDVPEMILSPDRASVYLLDRRRCRVLRVDAAQRTVDPRQAEVAPEAGGMCLTPDGKTLYVHSSPVPLALQPLQRSYPGRIQAFDAASFQARADFALEIRPESIAATNEGFLLVLGKADSSRRLFAVDVARTSLVSHIAGGWGDGADLQLSPDRTRLYVGSLALPLPDLKKIPWMFQPSTLLQVRDKGRAVVSPDGAYLASSTGPVYRLSKANPSELISAATLPASASLAMDSAAPQVWHSDLQGTLRLYTYPEFKEVKAQPLGARVYRIALDPQANALYCLMDADPWTTQQTEYDRRPQGGHLHIYNLKTLTGADPK